MRAELEIKNYLLKNEFNEKVIDKIITKLKKERYLNEDEYIKAYINDQYNLTNNGPYKIKRGLINLGIAEEKINIDCDFDLKIKSLIKKRINQNRKYNTYKLRINISNYLFNLGYSKEMFEDYIKEIFIDDSIFIKKEYDKLYNKYKSKYSKDKLQYVIKDKLYKNGYSTDLINEVIKGV